jgi:hypothetical protein
MSLSAKFDTAHRQLKAMLEEHTAMVDSRLAAIETRLDNPGYHAPIDTAMVGTGPDSMLAERDRLKAGLEGLAFEFEIVRTERDEAREESALLMGERDAGLGEIEKLKVELEWVRKELEQFKSENFSLALDIRKAIEEKEILKRDLDERDSLVWALRMDLEEARSAHYAGCYWIGAAKGRLTLVQEVMIVLGGDVYLAETIGVDETTVRNWRRVGFIPPRYRSQIEDLLLERGYVVDKSIFRSLTREESAAIYGKAQ